MSAKRFGCAAVVMRGNLYVIGGDDYLNNAYSTVEVLRLQPGSSLVTDSPSQEPLVLKHPLSNRAIMGPASHQPPSTQLPITMQSTQRKISIAAEVVQDDETHVSYPSTALTVGNNLSMATTEEVCQWLSNHGVSKVTLDDDIIISYPSTAVSVGENLPNATIEE
eukprot:10294811-Ditylum_brightwellii.AAC.1